MHNIHDMDQFVLPVYFLCILSLMVMNVDVHIIVGSILMASGYWMVTHLYYDMFYVILGYMSIIYGYYVL